MPDPKPDRPDVNNYLERSDIVDYDHPIVREVAKHLTYGCSDSLTSAKAIYDFVKNQIFHSFQINATSVTIKASEVLDKGHGTCYSKAHLLAAIMRVSGIPAGFCYQLRYDRETERLFVHGFNAVYIHDFNKWIRLDASFHTEEEQEHYDPFLEQPGREQPELAINKKLGERDNSTVYLSPGKRVIKAMEAFYTVADLRNHMPARI